MVIGEKQKDTDDVFQFFAKQRYTKLYHASENIMLDNVKISGTGLSLECRDEILGEGQIYLPLMAEYQINNLKTSLQVLRLLRTDNYEISWSSIRDGLKNLLQNTGFKGRFQVLGQKPLILVDSGHNVGAVTRVMKQIKQLDVDKKHFVIGMVNDKEITKLLELMPQDAKYYFAKADIPRGLPAESLKTVAGEAGLTGETFSTVEEAVDTAKKAASEHDLIFIGGSTFVVAEVV